MEQAAVPAKPERLVSLDVFRGLTIAGMVLVNNPGSWSTIYKPLGHAPWDGWTPTDWIFPFFLFIVGVAMTLAFDKRLARGASRAHLLSQVFCRSCVLFLLGLILAGFPNFRLCTPFILAIAGLQFLFADPPPPSADGAKPGNWRTPAGWTALGIAIIWFVVDFRYFNGPAPRSSFAHLFPLTSDGSGSAIRIPGVLQRIGLCYAAASVIMMFAKVPGRIVWTVSLIVVYWVIMKYFDAPAGYVIGNGLEGVSIDATEGAPFPGRLNDWIDVKLLGAHLYAHRPDPEGLLSTIPAIATTLLGILTGTYILSPKYSKQSKAVGMVVGGLVLLAVGQAMHYGFPINKKIWTSSYVVFMAGWAGVILGACYYFIDVLGFKKWSVPFLVLGTNAILAFFGSGILARLMAMIKWGEGEQAVTLKAWLYGFYTSGIADPKLASLLWSLSYVALWTLLITPLYRKRIFLKV